MKKHTKYILTLLPFIFILLPTYFIYISPDYYIKKKYTFFRYLSKNFQATEVLNFKMFLNSKDEMITPFISAFHHWEPLETTAVYKNLKEGDVFVDVGANVGYYTIMAALKVGTSGHVYAFEPEPENFEILQQNIRLNKLNNVTIERKAVADHSGKMKLYLAEKNKGDHSLREDDKTRKSIEVDVVSLDEYLSGKKVDFIKIDVQGADGLVMRGANKIIDKNPNILIVTEFNAHNYRLLNTEPISIFNDFTSKNFIFFNIDDKKSIIKKITTEEIMEKYDIFGVETNILIVPKNRNIEIE